MQQEYLATLRERLDELQFEDPNARRQAMKEELDFLQKDVANFIQTVKESGKSRAALSHIIKPVLAMVGSIYFYCEDNIF